MSERRSEPKKPTIYDVAERAGVSTFTVSRVINQSGYVREPTRQKVERAVAELGFVPSVMARKLRTQRSDVVALILSDVTNPFWAKVIEGVQGYFSAKGVSIMLGNARGDLAEERAQAEMAIAQGVDGVLITPLTDASGEAIRFVTEQGVPCVALDKRGDFGVDVVRCDSVEASYQLVKHLLDLGHRRIGLVNGPRDRSTARDRYQGYVNALASVGMPPEDELVSWGSYTTEQGAEGAEALLALAHPPTAIFAANNSLASGVMDLLNRRSVAVPQQMAVVGFDEIPSLESFLTLAAQPSSEMGRVGAEMLHERIRGYDGPPRERLLPVEMRVRVSCGAGLVADPSGRAAPFAYPAPEPAQRGGAGDKSL